MNFPTDNACLPEWGLYFEDAAKELVALIARSRRLSRQLGHYEVVDHLDEAQVVAELIWVYGHRLFQDSEEIRIDGRPLHLDEDLD